LLFLRLFLEGVYVRVLGLDASKSTLSIDDNEVVLG
jgi:hypothetical protein